MFPKSFVENYKSDKNLQKRLKDKFTIKFILGGEETDNDNEELFGKPKPGWSPHYVQYVQTNYDVIFTSMYDENFIDRIFSANSSKITRKEFITSIVGNAADFAEELKDKIE